MQYDAMDYAPIGEITSGIQLKTLVKQTITFVQQHLPTWRDDLRRPHEQAEDRLTAQLSKHLNHHATMFIFSTQEPQRGSRSIDLSVTLADVDFIEGRRYTYYDCFLYIECKRLPTPTPKREREYVTGITKSSGAMQRFKLGVHGHENDVAVIIGYVQNGSCAKWYQIINSWIDDLIAGNVRDGCSWHDGEQLVCYAEDPRGLARCESLHPRNNAQDIRIVHLWIDMCHK